MDELQLYQKVQDLLQARKWTGNAAYELVFPTNTSSETSVRISARRIEELLDQVRPPFAIIVPGPGTADPQFGEHPDLIQQRFSVILGTSLFGDDPLGENSLTGAHKTGTGIGGVGSSRGRGILEIQRELFDVLQNLNPADSVTIQSTGDRFAPVEHVGEYDSVVTRRYEFTAWITT